MIDYGKLDFSVKYYEEKGFVRVETPWLVTEAIDSITRPKGVEPYIVESKKKNLIASGEQGFLYQYLKEYLPKGKFQTITPCFRNDSFDLTHTKYFMKNELIQTNIVNETELDKIVNIALGVFQPYFLEDLDILETEDGFDINHGNIELGSYGIRECEFLKWIYGTGWAEPRMSNLINRYHGE